MKKSRLQNASYRILLTNFKEWLDILGYSEGMRKNYPNQLCEFFYWLEQNNINHIDYIEDHHIRKYYGDLKQRPNKTRGGALSNIYLNNHLQSLHKFREYLKKHNKKPFNLPIKRENSTIVEKLNVLSQEEIKDLFMATGYSNPLPRFRARQKALLVCLYSCGMRRNEVLNLEISDILFDKERIYVRKGKNYKERFIPINLYNLQILEDYVYDARMNFKKSSESNYVFITERSIKMGSSAIENDLKQVIKATEDSSLIEKNITPHALRHSIATHFLQAGMKIEDIQQFLGHSSLESTQIYTHILKHK
ncbi:tyrosine-type recombinase/integrase [Aquimarina sp. RZ0]|uniref:tyrosine-type recombinase/integrase n=1 Tax=Aquimarina sp. RZ0 TaxID=2607730 RepID=UPI0011F37F06|nr:tyrosine-type recombinase/integrase [Aquimarina sp. RZ0]KAA1240369.1 tyrosine-type recombinase/integrase [Aquimarina sp. RZ0]